MDMEHALAVVKERLKVGECVFGQWKVGECPFGKTLSATFGIYNDKIGFLIAKKRH